MRLVGSIGVWTNEDMSWEFRLEDFDTTWDGYIHCRLKQIRSTPMNRYAFEASRSGILSLNAIIFMTGS